MIFSNEENYIGIKENDIFTYPLENGTIREIGVQSVIEEIWEYGGRKISPEQLVKILNYIKSVTSQK
ncbi:hypothetical protein [Paenibacillus sp. FSL L8-0638]|uniref:hypothetical protein n=1 Tax=Paenibacillus TaxID=44249 RepID=UPI0031595C46